MNVTRTFCRASDFNSLKDLLLQRPSQSLDGLQTILPYRVFELLDRVDAELLVELEHLVRTKPRDGEHFEDALGDFLTQLFQGGMRASTLQFCDDIRNRVPYAGNLMQPTFRDHAVERLGKCGQILRGPLIGFRSVWVTSPKCGTAPPTGKM